MRGSGWVLPAFALALWIVSVGWPAIAVILAFMSMSPSETRARPPSELLTTSVAWALGVAGGAMVLGWLPGRWLGRSLHTTGAAFVLRAMLILTPICVPSYIVFYAWWQSWPFDTAFHRWVIARDAMGLARQGTLWLGLVCWSWPLVAWCVAGATAATANQREEMLQIDGARWPTRLIDRLRCDARGLFIGGLLVFVATFNNTTCFDLAEVFTFANELRAMDALDANARDTLAAGLPAMAITAAGAVALWFMLARPSHEHAVRGGQSHRATAIAAGVIWGLSVLLPLALFARQILGGGANGASVSEFVTLYSRSVLHTLMLALLSGTIACLMTIALTILWQDHRSVLRMLATTMALGWLIAAVMPGTIVGVALEAAYNRAGLDWLAYRSPMILLIAHLSAFGFVAALMGRWAASAEAATLTDLRRLDGAQTLGGIVRTTWPTLLMSGVASLAVVFVLALGEIAVSAQVNPPLPLDWRPFSMVLLSAMHYQEPQTIMIAAVGMMAGALLAALTLALLWRAFRLRKKISATFRVLLGFAVTMSLCACGEIDPANLPPLEPHLVFGSPGTALGQFGRPRALDVDPVNHFVYVIDKTARVQRFGFDGEPQLLWPMPERENGKPTGVTVGSDGTVYVADTHYFRVIAYDASGNEKFRLGENGTGPGQFIYTTDIAIGPEGRLYVSEYGGNDRVQVFSPEGRFLFAFGSFGEEVGQFKRPQAMTFNHEMTELFIADACNHRIVVTDPQGKVLRMFGRAGQRAGEFAYPYSVEALADGTIVVGEFGNHRIQHLDAQGRPLGMQGRLGRAEGELIEPWAVAANDEDLFVLDSGNNRVHVIRSP